MSKVNANVIMKTLDWSYEKAVNGFTGFDSAEELAQNYLKNSKDINEAVDSLIRWQVSKSATSGFITGIGGAITMPVAIPANIASVMLVQVRMIAAIAHMGGFDLRDDQVKSFVYICLCGNGAKDILKEVGIVIGTKLTQSAIRKLSSAVITKINQTVGFRLLTKFGQKGVINLGKAVPLVGGIVGATFDGTATRTIGKVAKQAFIIQ
ncbi:EcsC family protein [Paenibacillus sp. ATY16]|uniref:EcsC family protein n=1 Tax=Paenibacillus sp. ATY16 TaxID=1759312 RepID=UPI00200CC752|nr:EcsC family protein [Paenibacillus sp. ATY16]MCK9858327.1 EcsC family protein [Paenibacillus sp. ATY16]